LGGRVFVIGGIAIAVAGLLKPEWSGSIVLIGSLSAAFIPVVYSYVVYRRVRREERGDTAQDPPPNHPQS
jgi:uncharacterized membrane protein